MIAMGIDASTTSSGWGIFFDGSLHKYGKIVNKDKTLDWRQRITFMAQEIDKLIKEYSPDVIYMEDVPLKSGANSTLLKLGVLQGSVLGVVASNGCTVHFIPVSTWRSIMGLFDGTSKGKERNELKKRSIEKANHLFGLNLAYVSPASSKNDDDVSDAILVCYSQLMEAKPKLGRKAKV